MGFAPNQPVRIRNENSVVFGILGGLSLKKKND